VGDWNLFFATTAGSSATLVGLLFLATQLHIDVFTDSQNRWAALAQATLTMLSVDFVLSLFFLVPQVSLQGRGLIALVVIAVAIWRSIAIWWPVVRIVEKGRRHRLAQSFWLLVLPVVAYVYTAIGAGQVVDGQSASVLTVASGIVLLFAISLRNAWRLVVSVAREAA
jgi:hypothetical protein